MREIDSWPQAVGIPYSRSWTDADRNNRYTRWRPFPERHLGMGPQGGPKALILVSMLHGERCVRHAPHPPLHRGSLPPIPDILNIIHESSFPLVSVLPRPSKFSTVDSILDVVYEPPFHVHDGYWHTTVRVVLFTILSDSSPLRALCTDVGKPYLVNCSFT